MKIEQICKPEQFNRIWIEGAPNHFIRVETYRGIWYQWSPTGFDIVDNGEACELEAAYQAKILEAAHENTN